MQTKLHNFLTIALVLLLSACGVFQNETSDETANWSAARLYAEAQDELSTGNFDNAISYFEKLESRYPFGTYAQQAQMEIAYTHYRQEDTALALAAADRFIKLHPDHPNVDYMYYLRGLINFNDRMGMFEFLARQDPSERDPRAARDAFDSFKQLVERFPNSIYAEDARERLRYLFNSMAQYDVHVANYYYRRGAYLAAANRAQATVRDYRDAPAIEEALFIMVRSYDALGMTELRDDADRVFKKNFPNSVFLKGGRKDSKPWWQIW